MHCRRGSASSASIRGWTRAGATAGRAALRVASASLQSRHSASWAGIGVRHPITRSRLLRRPLSRGTGHPARSPVARSASRRASSAHLTRSGGRHPRLPAPWRIRIDSPISSTRRRTPCRIKAVRPPRGFLRGRYEPRRAEGAPAEAPPRAPRQPSTPGCLLPIAIRWMMCPRRSPPRSDDTAHPKNADPVPAPIAADLPRDAVILPNPSGPPPVVASASIQQGEESESHTG